MKSVIIDSSSAILLYRCSMLSAMAKFCNPVIPPAVFRELTLPGYEGADHFLQLCDDGLIKVYEPDDEIKHVLSRSLHEGERAVISLYKEGKGDYIIIDDGKGGAYCRDNNIPYINALLAVKILFFSKLVTETEYVYAWRWLLANGRYSVKVAVFAENMDEQMLSAFM